MSFTLEGWGWWKLLQLVGKHIIINDCFRFNNGEIGIKDARYKDIVVEFFEL